MKTPFELEKEFKAIHSDSERIKWLLANKDENITVMLDNDSTYIQLNDSDFDDVWMDFFSCFGDDDLVFILLTELGIDVEYV